MKYVLTVLYLIFTTLGIFLLKIGGDSFAVSIKPILNIKMNYLTLLGFISYVCSFLLWQKLLVTYDLTYIVPITAAIVQVLVLIVGAIFFKEQINFISILGTFIVIIGIVLITISKK